jgi:rod shape-determining protein MreD
VRSATVVLVAYVMCIVVTSIWYHLPWGFADAIPNVGALTAAYLGHTSRPFLAPSSGAAAATGYLIDIVSGTPIGLTSLVLVFTVAIARETQQRVLVRGTAMTIGFSAFISATASILTLVIRALFKMPFASAAVEAKHVALVAVATALLGPLVWYTFRRIDAAYARTARDRDAALEGITR